MNRVLLTYARSVTKPLKRVILEDLYEVVEYETGGEALAGFAQDKPDPVLLDISLPEMAGTGKTP